MVLVCAILGTFLFSTQKDYYANCLPLCTKNYLAQYLADVINEELNSMSKMLTEVYKKNN